MNGLLKIKISGFNTNRIINELINKEIFIKNLKVKQKYILFEIEEKEEYKLKDICKKFHKKYEVVSKRNFKLFICKLKNYFGFVLSFFLIISIFLSFNIYVYEVNVSYVSSFEFNLSSVENLLINNGVVCGCKRNDINCFEIQKLILETQENVSGCTVKINGGKIDIVVYPGIMKQEKETDNVYSKYNAVVSSVEIFAGKSNIKSGDIVKVGDLLIENNNGASGKIIAKVYYSNYIIYNENQTEKQFTGNTQVSYEINLFNKILQKYNNNCIFSNYFTEKCVFCISKNTFIPLYFIKNVYKEFIYVDKKIPFLDVESKLKNDLYNEVLEKIENKNKITNVTYSVFSEKNLTRLDCFVECEINLTE